MLRQGQVRYLVDAVASKRRKKWLWDWWSISGDIWNIGIVIVGVVWSQGAETELLHNPHHSTMLCLERVHPLVLAFNFCICCWQLAFGLAQLRKVDGVYLVLVVQVVCRGHFVAGSWLLLVGIGCHFDRLRSGALRLSIRHCLCCKW